MLLSVASQAAAAPLLPETIQPSPAPWDAQPPLASASPRPSPIAFHRAEPQPSPVAFQRAPDQPAQHEGTSAQENWCPGRCPPHRTLNAEDMFQRLKQLNANFTWESDYEIGAVPTRCDPCAHRWLFVASLGGRTGSTTILDMLDQHPAVQLTGENGGQLLSAMTLWEQTARQSFTSGPWVRGKPNPANLVCDLQSWFMDANPPLHDKGENAIRGFKEVRFGPVDDYGLARLTDRRVPPPKDGDEHQAFLHTLKDPFHFLDMVFPCHRIVYSDRAEKFALKWGDESVKPRLRDAWKPMYDRDREEERNWHSFWFDLADFSQGRFNDMLQWMGEDGCSYHDMIHANANLDDKNYDIFDTNMKRNKCTLR